MRTLIALCALLLSAAASAAPTNLAWDYGAVTGISGFRLYCATAKPYSATPTLSVTAANKTATTDLAGGLLPVTYTCVVRAYVTGGLESADSNEVSIPIPATAPPAPSNLRFTVTLTWVPEKGVYVAKVGAVKEVQ